MAGKIWPIPQGTPAARCSRCPAVIYFVLTPNGKQMPVDPNVAGGVDPAPDFAGAGVSHFETCPAAKHFSGRNR